MRIRYPAPLQPGDRIGVTAPSSGVPEALRDRLASAIRQRPSRFHRAEGFDRWDDDRTVTDYTLDTPGTWRLLDAGRSPPAGG